MTNKELDRIEDWCHRNLMTDAYRNTRALITEVRRLRELLAAIEADRDRLLAERLRVNEDREPIGGYDDGYTI